MPRIERRTTEDAIRVIPYGSRSLYCVEPNHLSGDLINRSDDLVTLTENALLMRL